jgi:hypothetical protein
MATDRPEPQMVRKPGFEQVHEGARPETEQAFANVVTTLPERGRVLTDDYNPLEFYDAHNREQIRRSLALNTREM